MNQLDTEYYNNIIEAIRKSISEVHSIDIHGIILVSEGTLPKTISGKKQRHVCKEMYLNSNLPNVLYKNIKGSLQNPSHNI